MQAPQAPVPPQAARTRRRVVSSASRTDTRGWTASLVVVAPDWTVRVCLPSFTSVRSEMLPV